MTHLAFEVNGKPVEVDVPDSRRLLDVLRDDLGLQGTKEGCAIGECGACTVILDGRAVNSCLVLAGQVEGSRVETVEGLDREGELSRLQQAFLEHGAVQCGFCTPGMLLSAKALLDRCPAPTRDQVLEAIEGNLCRCTGYVPVVESIEAASEGTDTGR